MTANPTELPADWQCYPWPIGWGTGSMPMVRIGYALIPARFILAIRTPAAGAGAVVLDFAARQDVLTIAAIHGIGLDLAEHVTAIVAAKTSAEWSKYGRQEVLHFLADAHPEWGDAGRIEGIEKEVRPLLRALSGTPQQPTAQQHPQGLSKRYRVTDDHLRRVVAAYRSANAAGRGPTIAVANHFGVAHSTAAKWVGTARRRGFLPPTVKGMTS